jgi:predicted transcriptional regulator of viral defense system
MVKKAANTPLPPLERALALFAGHGGMLRTSEALALGVHPRTLYQLRDQGRILQLARGLYRLADLPALEEPDLVAVARRLPEAVICLISALALHGLTTQIPHEVCVALPRGVRTPRLVYPPVRVFRMSGACLQQGIETHAFDGVAVRVFGAAKTVVDCFKFRNKIGLDVAVEALRAALAQPDVTPAGLMHYAAACRVETVIRPYLEALQ